MRRKNIFAASSLALLLLAAGCSKKTEPTTSPTPPSVSATGTANVASTASIPAPQNEGRQ